MTAFDNITGQNITTEHIGHIVDEFCWNNTQHKKYAIDVLSNNIYDDTTIPELRGICKNIYTRLNK